MNARTHAELANFIWDICNLLRGPYKRNEYRKVILPLTVLRRFDAILEPTKAAVLEVHEANRGREESLRDALLRQASGHQFYNTSRLDFPRLLDAPDDLPGNLAGYVSGFSPNVREILERFGFDEQIARMNAKNLLFRVIKAFNDPKVDLSPERVDNRQMGYAFEELIRISAEESNEEAEAHFTPREVIQLMVNLLLSPESDLSKSNVVRTIYDPACGTGGMLSTAEEYMRDLNAEARPFLYGQDYNDEAWAICRSDMLIKGEDAENIRDGDTFTQDKFDHMPSGGKWTFDYMLANPPFGVEWKQQEDHVRREARTLGFGGRFGAGLPRIDNGSLLFLQHMISKMRPITEGGSRIGILFNGSPLFNGDAGQGESEIRRWVLENDWLEAIVALPEQLFYRTTSGTYIWILTNRKEARRRGKVQLIDGRRFFRKMRKSLGNKRNELSQDDIDDLTRIHGAFEDGETRPVTDDDPVTHLPRTRDRVVSKVFANEDFGFHKITVERPLRLNFAATPERIARLEDEKAFLNLARSKKRPGSAHDEEVEAGRLRQEAIRGLLAALADSTAGEVYRDREAFRAALKHAERAAGLRLSAPERKPIESALCERDPDAEICRDSKGNPESDADLRDTETVPLKEDIAAYFAREVLPHVPDAWIDESKTKVGYEIPLNRHFYVYEPPRPLEEIEADLKALEHEIVELLSEVTAS
ncbi:MAG: type I restriction-modification system subunit M [Dehalococcoidia bacterium]|nr:type I restriction-modification system subunit M [Dehalococcoidia bacterium]